MEDQRTRNECRIGASVDSLKYVIPLLVLSLMGTLAAARPHSAPQWMTLDPSGKFLVNQVTSKPVFITGDAPQTLFVEVRDADVELYLRDRASRRFNALWVYPVDKTDQTRAPKNFYNQSPFDGPDFTHEDSRYWRHVDHVLKRIRAYGMVAVMDPGFVGMRSTDGYFSSYLSSSDNVMRAYGAWIGKRYRDYPNIIWSLGGDACKKEDRIYRKLNDVAQGIRSTDPNHLLTLEACRQQSTLDAWSQSTPMNLNWVYPSWPTSRSACAQEASRTRTLPSMVGEDWYEGEHEMNPLKLREEAYWAILSGCTLGRFFGNQAIYSMGGPLNKMGQSWQSQLASPGSVSEGWQGALMRSREFWKLTADSSNAVLTGGIGSGPSISVAACTSDSQTCFVYDPAGDAQVPQIALSHFSGAVRAWWFNPSRGTTTDLGEFPNQGTKEFIPPDGNDWVLVIDLESAHLPPPGSGDM